ncbi:transposase [Okeania sp. KiyG1]|uniref:RNA-guided endonuclease InsQ/TnpB family protein n=1 Tax=Okeania sp. KiyG1 TaxID=2720165 RepID=UPI0021054052|nr:transposase [Okeania sp. KiyG1]
MNDSLACCQEKHNSGEKKPINSELQKLFITQAKKTECREWLSEVSNIPLQQSLNDLNRRGERPFAPTNFFKSTQGQRKGKPVKPPKFKSKKSLATARFTKGGFKVGQHKVYLAKIGKLKIVWSRELPAAPSSVTVIKDVGANGRSPLHRYFLSFVVEIQPEILPQTDNSVGIDLGIKTFATFSDGTKVDAPKPLKKRIKKLRKVKFVIIS